MHKPLDSLALRPALHTCHSAQCLPTLPPSLAAGPVEIFHRSIDTGDSGNGERLP
jgi:hypothetical protein